MLEKGTFESTQQKEDWQKILKLDLISSEESDLDEGEEVMVTKPLPWRSSNVTRFFGKLDEECRQNKSPQARRQMKPRRSGLPSSRPQPSTEGFPDWVFPPHDQ